MPDDFSSGSQVIVLIWWHLSNKRHEYPADVACSTCHFPIRISLPRHDTYVMSVCLLRYFVRTVVRWFGRSDGRSVAMLLCRSFLYVLIYVFLSVFLS